MLGAGGVPPAANWWHPRRTGALWPRLPKGAKGESVLIASQRKRSVHAEGRRRHCLAHLFGQLAPVDIGQRQVQILRRLYCARCIVVCEAQARRRSEKVDRLRLCLGQGFHRDSSGQPVIDLHPGMTVGPIPISSARVRHRLRFDQARTNHQGAPRRCCKRFLAPVSSA